MKTLDTHEYEFESASFTENRGTSILTVLGGWNRNRYGLEQKTKLYCGHVWL